MRTNIRTLVTLDTVFSSPFRYINCDTPFFVSGCTGFERSVLDSFECRNRKDIAFLCIDNIDNIADKRRAFFCTVVVSIGKCCPFGRNFDFLNVVATGVNSCKVHLNNGFAFHAIRFHDVFLHVFNSQFVRNDIGDFEEGTLHNGVGTVAQTKVNSQFCAVDNIEVDLVFGQIFFHLKGKAVFNLFFFPNGIQQE